LSIINSQMVSAFTFRKQVEYEKNRLYLEDSNHITIAKPCNL